MHLPSTTARPRQLAAAARTLLTAWRNRSREKPYTFGHGPRFVDGKWPPTWYDASAVLEARAPYPSRKGKTASTEDRSSTREIVQALASTFGPEGLITPRSCYMLRSADPCVAHHAVETLDLAPASEQQVAAS